MAMRLKREDGQMTVELVVVLPVVLIIALVGINAMTFFGECSAFDRISRNAARVYGTSLEYGQTAHQACARMQTAIDAVMDAPNTDTSVSVSGSALGHTTYTMKLTYHPTLFGLGLRDSFFGVSAPALEHTTTLTVDAYKPGMLF